VKDLAFNLSTCQGAVVFDSCDNYSIANAAGNGLYLMRNGITVRNVKIYHPSCEGIAVHASNCTIDGAVIEGSKGAAIALCGSKPVTSQTNSSVHARLLRPTDINQAAPDL